MFVVCKSVVPKRSKLPTSFMFPSKNDLPTLAITYSLLLTKLVFNAIRPAVITPETSRAGV